ncbi:MAG: helix-turn-helix transcriptional regulator [Acidaminococcus sp.]|jgi:transcriptional regulator with XRE-family HTH domain|nr:helix-turn-helix transcriptional regulator [Acidaminococcus sp.]MCI2116638.1 helix-turn-helix transcriptional regulator [Acidaminococcus sp.]
MEGYTLKALRVMKNLTQYEAGKLVGVSEDTWSNWERKKTFPDVPHIKAIEKAFNVPYNNIIFLP